jgi:signal transduction histidine kinase
VSADTAVVSLADVDRHEWKLLWTHGHDEATRRALSRVPIGDTPLAPVLSEARPVVSQVGAPADPGWEGIAALGLATVAAVPLRLRSKVLGALAVGFRSRRDPPPSSIDLLQAMAAHFAAAIEMHHLIGDLRKRVGEMTQLSGQLVQRERLAALGELAAIVAHEVRNPLGVIFNSLSSLRRMAGAQRDARMLLDIVSEECDRLNRIVGDLLDFARPSSPALEPAPLAPVIENAIAAALGDARSRVATVQDVPATLPPVPMDEILMRQALYNLATNGVQAMPGGGTLTVRARLDGGSVVVEVSDTGAGIPENVRRRIFEPFFTTKATGTGLGLAVVKRIVVDDHHGEIDVVSAPGAGSTFVVRLPLEPRRDARVAESS